MHDLVANAALVFSLMLVLWGVSIAVRDVSIVDPWWSVGFLLVTARGAWAHPLTLAKGLLLGAVALWAVRLWWHLLRRARGKPEDARYTALRRKWSPRGWVWVSLGQVFLFQGVLILVISAPLQLAMDASVPDPLGLRVGVGLALFLTGFLLEVVADAQLQAFRETKGPARPVLDTGVWRWSRHPNYFGEALLQVGLWLMAASQPWGWAAVGAPLLMTFLLVRVSGVTLLDRHLEKTRPGYADYMARTAAFIPRRPRRNGPEA